MHLWRDSRIGRTPAAIVDRTAERMTWPTCRESGEIMWQTTRNLVHKEAKMLKAPGLRPCWRLWALIIMSFLTILCGAPVTDASKFLDFDSTSDCAGVDCEQGLLGGPPTTSVSSSGNSADPCLPVSASECNRSWNALFYKLNFLFTLYDADKDEAEDRCITWCLLVPKRHWS
jgi:hypothetical protein